MRSATEFGAEAWDRHDPYPIAVLFAAGCHRASCDRVLRVLYIRVHGNVADDVLVDVRLDLELLFTGHRSEVREVESEPIRRHERAGLLDVRTEHVPERGVEEVCRRMVAPRRVT